METTGCGTAIVTPFKADGSIDEPALWALVNWQIESGIDFIVACGSTGEAATLDEDGVAAHRSHRHRSRGRPRAGVGRMHAQLHAHCCCARLRCCDMCRALTPCSPPTPTTTSPRRKASSSIFWRWPRLSTRFPSAFTTCRAARASTSIRRLLLRLAEAAPNIQAIKEASGKLPQIAELVHPLPRDFKVFSGDDNLALAAIGVGAHGLISVASNEIPAESGRA